ncbi:transcriptional activator NhaR [candidate division GN15 bacterium]|nr:transcriptional activator NhaR [candidate division GN15 bacterium]
MTWLNYNHLWYFWTVARAGGVVAAAKELRLAPSTISNQVHQLEESLGQKLFVRAGRRLDLSEAGRVAFRFAEEIFSLGRDLQDTLAGRLTDKPQRLEVGVTQVLPKLVSWKLLAPLETLDNRIRLICREGAHQSLLSELAQHRLDVVLTDMPVTADSGIRAYNHLLGECGVELFATEELADRCGTALPGSLQGAPFLLPTYESSLRHLLEQWFERHRVRPDVVAEFEDSALLKVFAQKGAGMFVAPSVIADEVIRQYHVRSLGPMEGIVERFYAVSAERRFGHPAVEALAEAARERLFG